MFHIAGVTLPVPPTQVVEALVVFITFSFLQFSLFGVYTIAPIAEAEAGAVRRMPTSFVSKVLSPAHGLVTFLPPVIYVLCVTANWFTQPSWMQRMNLPHNYVSQETEVALRVTACASTLALFGLFERSFNHLGSQWHVIGRREKSRLVQTGPYAVVRHPLYLTVIVQQALFVVMFWSYVSLGAFGFVAAALALKMPIEEDVILKDPAVAAEYRAYMQRVPARIIPFVW